MSTCMSTCMCLMSVGVLDLTTPVYPDRPSLANTAIPAIVHITHSNLCVVRYYMRSSVSSSHLAAEHAPLAIFRVLDLDHPTLQHPSAVVGALHATPVDWHVSDVDGDAHQLIPHCAPYLQGQQLCAYMCATEESRVLRLLSPKDGEGSHIQADSLVYSGVQHVCLVFSALVEVRGLPSPPFVTLRMHVISWLTPGCQERLVRGLAGAAPVHTLRPQGCRLSPRSLVLQDSTKRFFTYIDMGSGTEPTVPSPAYQPGIMGTFVGSTDDKFVVLESNKLGSDNLAVYSSTSAFSDDSLLGYTYAELATGDSVMALWQGPPASHLLQVWLPTTSLYLRCRRRCVASVWAARLLLSLLCVSGACSVCLWLVARKLRPMLRPPSAWSSEGGCGGSVRGVVMRAGAVAADQSCTFHEFSPTMAGLFLGTVHWR
jgi:hypothetical protein